MSGMLSQLLSSLFCFYLTLDSRVSMLEMFFTDSVYLNSKYPLLEPHLDLDKVVKKGIKMNQIIFTCVVCGEKTIMKRDRGRVWEPECKFV